ncbi:MAG: ABC transporter permease [Syntrophomonadaceae bacterium]|nr:ABC transporter permease [Syntrophomonadaceae bacterium]
MINMKDDLVVFLWHRRLSARLKLILEGFKLIVDFWTALYIVIPALILLVYTWLQLLVGLPSWFVPAGEVLLVPVLAWFMASGSPRSYLNETDLTFLQPGSGEFNRLFRVGFLSSLALNNLWILLLMVVLFPFYLHLEAVSLPVWLGVGLWILILRTTFMQILFLIRAWVSRLGFRVLYFMGFIIAWNVVTLPFIRTGGTLYMTLMLGTALFMLVMAMLARLFLPINNWTRLVQDETSYDIQLMGHLLGYAAKPARKRNGTSIWSQHRFAIPFSKRYTLTYLYVKYFLRLKLIWLIFMEIGAVCLAVSLSAVPYWVILCFLAAGDLMLGLLVRSLVAENSGKLDLYIRAFDNRDVINGLRSLYIIMMVPLAFLPVFSGLAGTMSLVQVLGGIIVLLIWVFAALRQLLNSSNIQRINW